MARAKLPDSGKKMQRVTPQNVARFKDVLDYLKQDLHHETKPK